MRERRKSTVVCAALALAAILGAAAGPAGAQPAPGPVKRIVYTKRIAGPGEILSFTVHCPRGWVAVSGAIVANPAALPVLYARPRPGARWTFALDNRAGSQPAEVRVQVACLRVRPLGKRRWVRLGTKTVQGRFTFIEAPLRLRGPTCPKPRKMAGRGVEFRRAKRKRVARSSTRPTGVPVEVVESWVARTGRGERAETSLAGTGREALEVRVSAVCIAPAAVSGPVGRHGRRPATHRFPIRIALPEADVSIAPGTNRATANCPGHGLSLATGFVFPPDEGLSLFRSFPTRGPRALWEIDSPAPVEVMVRLQAQCVDLDAEWE